MKLSIGHPFQVFKAHQYQFWHQSSTALGGLSSIYSSCAMMDLGDGERQNPGICHFPLLHDHVPSIDHLAYGLQLDSHIQAPGFHCTSPEESAVVSRVMRDAERKIARASEDHRRKASESQNRTDGDTSKHRLKKQEKVIITKHTASFNNMR